MSRRILVQVRRHGLIPMACLLLTGCAIWPGSSSTTPPEAAPAIAETEGPARMTYLLASDFNAEFYRTLRQQPDRLLIEFPGQDTSINKLPTEIAALIDGAAERGSGVKLVAWDDTVQMRSLGLLEIKAVIEGARYLRALGQLSQREIRRLRQRQLGEYDIDLLFDPHSGRLLYLHLQRQHDEA